MEDVPSSSGSNWVSFFAGMGFRPSLVNKVIEEKGEENAEMLLEALLAYSNLPQPKEELFDDGSSFGITYDSSADPHATESFHKSKSASESLGKKKSWLGEKPPVKEEPEVLSGDMDAKVSSMLKMNFSLDEIGAAMDKLGKYASTSQLIDYIIASRMTQKYEKDANRHGVEQSGKDQTNEALFGIMDKTLQLLDMGFSESQISTAFEICGSDATVIELANSIVAPESVVIADKSFTSLPHDNIEDLKLPFELLVKTEGYESVIGSQVTMSEPAEKSKGKKLARGLGSKPNSKKPRIELTENTLTDPMEFEDQKDISLPPTSGQSFWRQIDLYLEADRKPNLLPKPSRNLTSVAVKRPYFLFGSTTELPPSTWAKVSQFLYSIQPEFVDTRQYSALGRIEGYVHNLPIEDRCHISPKGPMTIEEAIPSLRKWKPSWDHRRHIILAECCDPSAASHLCERFGRQLAECEGYPSLEQQRSILQHIEAKNLIWVGNYRLSPLGPENLERLLGYPIHHSQVPGITSSERVKSLMLSFQTDSLGYHLSVLKRLFPEGVSVLSFFTGMGGPEVALHRLGIRLKGLVSIEPSEANRRILKKWWESSGQSGKLIQMESVEKLSSSKLETLSKTFAGFDFVVCQNPSDISVGLDYSQFMEFVRVFQRLRSFMNRSS